MMPSLFFGAVVIRCDARTIEEIPSGEYATGVVVRAHGKALQIPLA
jgi:hypothetical protein